MTDGNYGAKEELLQKVYDAGYEYESKYGCCGQCVLAAVQDVVGVGSDDVFKAAHTLSGGGGLSGQGTCGALAGAMLAVGLAYGRSRADFDKGMFNESFAKAKEVYDAFVAEFGSPICAGVQAKIMGRSFNMWDPEDYQAMEAAGAHEDKCPHVVGSAARMAADVLVEV